MFVSGPRPGGEPAVYFRRDFDVAGGVGRALLQVTALGVVEAYLNGSRVGDEVLAPGWTSYRHRLAVRTHDVTGLITPGRNTIGAICGEGWAVGPLGWDNFRGRYADRPAVMLRLSIEYPGRTQVVETDEQFRIGTGAVRGNGIYAGEEYDARLDDPLWSTPDFDDSGWEPAREFAWDPGTLVPATAEPIRRIETLVPISIRRVAPSQAIVDFGQNLSGWIRLTTNGKRGEIVTLRHAELLTPSGELETGTNRSAAATDRYTLRGGGPETWEPRFTFHGFRYAEISGPFESVDAVVVHTDMRRTGWFECSDELVNRLHANAVWSMRGNFVGLPTDCPQRDERLGWTGDINAFAPTATFLYGVRNLLGSWLSDLAAEQRAAGVVPWTVPDVFPMPVPHTPTALWGDAAVSVPWELYQEYGDLAILRSSWPSMAAHLRQVSEHLDADGLWTVGDQFGDWHDPDAPVSDPAAGKTGRHLVATAFLCKTSREVAATARLLGRDATPFARLASDARAAFRRAYVTPPGRVAGESATGYALAIMFGILDADERFLAGHRLAALVEEAGFTIPTGFAGTPLVLDALTRTGHLGAAYALLLQRNPPSFLYPVTMGATTCWERWEAILPDGTLDRTLVSSLNHYAFGAVADWLHRVVAGLTRTGPGWESMRVEPRPGGGLTSAAAAHETPRGRASVAWRRADGTMAIDVTVPPGTTAVVQLPAHAEAVGGGTYRWRYSG